MEKRWEEEEVSKDNPQCSLGFIVFEMPVSIHMEMSLPLENGELGGKVLES